MNLSLLTIVQDSARAFMYEHLAREVGVEIKHVEGAVHALTQLERMPIGAIICDAQLDDMTGAEFRQAVEEETGGKVPVFVLPSPQEFTPNGMPLREMKYGLELLKEVLAALSIPPERFPVPLNDHQEPQLQGNLNQFALTDLLNWVADMRFSGHWLITVHERASNDPSGPGRSQLCHMVMQDGKVRYADFAGQGGKVAMFAVLRAIEAFPETTFEFFKIKDAVTVNSSDLTQTTQRLLMELAVDLDHQHSHLHNN